MKYFIKILFLLAGFSLGIISLYAQDCASGYCPKSITVHHVIGDVSPETVTISYPVVETPLGSSDGSLNCWIAQNLGATSQASSVTDASVDAAGWFWQFGHKQGYAFNEELIPNSTWMANIEKTVDWETSLDPCRLLLGDAWRLPTKDEWGYAKSSETGGGWENVSDTYNSVLKLHGGGGLYINGSKSYTGIGQWWSSTWNTTSAPYFFQATSTRTRLNTYIASCGYTLRCLSKL